MQPNANHPYLVYENNIERLCCFDHRAGLCGFHEETHGIPRMPLRSLLGSLGILGGRGARLSLQLLRVAVRAAVGRTTSTTATATAASTATNRGDISATTAPAAAAFNGHTQWVEDSVAIQAPTAGAA